MNKIIIISTLMLLIISAVGCNEFLDKEPYAPSPASFFSSAEQLDAYAIARYGLLPATAGSSYSMGTSAGRDEYTDNQTGLSGENRWMPGEWKVSNASYWDWEDIYDINYFFQEVMPRYEKGEITGSKVLIDHYIGEMYFFRAHEHFSKLRSIGDCPIVLEAYADDKELLLAASIRQPRNKVVRQILKDLDAAIILLQEKHGGGSNRLSKNVAHLFKSRVALYEASWERNFAGTAFVPNGEAWPGKVIHPSYEYNAETEINFFLDEAMKSAKIVAEAITLSENPSTYDYTKNDGTQQNPYFEMFATVGQGLKSVSEVLLFRAYDKALVSHNMVTYIRRGGAGMGYTHQYMENFLMANGLPIYATNSNYKGDVHIKDMKEGRDSRFQLFVQAPSEVLNNDEFITTIAPDLLGIDYQTPTGYLIKKRAAVDADQWLGSHAGTIGDIVFRGVEAHLNYIEASYLRTGAIDGTADKYWRAIRRRANVDENYMNTVNATVMAEEAKVDLAAYTAGELITPLEYNIRRERRSEFIAEGFRMDDLYRYRALDQLVSKQTFIPQGINLWTEVWKIESKEFYDEGESLFIQAPASKANVSENKDFRTARDNQLKEGKYVYPLRVRDNLYYDGYKFAAAHYLYPIGATHLLNAAIADGSGELDAKKSNIYQNPGWSTIVGEGAQAVVGFQ